MIRVAVSGGFDPVHPDHLSLFKQAKELGDFLIVILNSDDFLIKKKQFIFMPLADRKEILESIKYVDEVVLSVDTDSSVSETLKLIKPNIFVKSGDRRGESEAKACEQIGCKRVYVKTGNRSSTQLVMNAIRQLTKKDIYDYK